jgi:hypothetical protein
MAYLEDLFAVQHGIGSEFLARNGALHDAAEFLAAGIGDQDLHEEAIELGFGQRVGALHLDGILGGHHQEGALQLVGGGAAGDRAFLHGFEQGRLGLGSGAVDFIGQHEVGEDGPGLEAEALAAVLVGVDDHAAHNVGGHEVGGELDAGILEVKGFGQGAQESGFAEAGHAFEQDVTSGQKADQDTFHDVVLTYDDFRDLPADGIQPVDCGLKIGLGTHILVYPRRLGAEKPGFFRRKDCRRGRYLRVDRSLHGHLRG